MSVGLTVGDNYYPFGPASSFYSWFSTVAVRLENEQWGSRFPHLMNTLYEGNLPADQVSAALDEFSTIKEEFSKLPPDAEVWDFDNRDKKSPFDREGYPSHFTSLNDVFIADAGENLMDEFHKALEDARENNKDIYVE